MREPLKVGFEIQKIAALLSEPKSLHSRNLSSLVNMAWCSRSKEDHFCGVEDAEHWESDTWHELCWQSAAIPNALPHRSQPHNSLQPPTTPPHYNRTLCHPHSTHTPHSTVQPSPLQRETSFLEDESLLSNALSTSHIHRSVSTKLLFVLSLSWQYASSGFILHY